MPGPDELQQFVNWCEEKDIYPVGEGDREWDWAELLNVWEAERRGGDGPRPPAPATPIRP